MMLNMASPRTEQVLSSVYIQKTDNRGPRQILPYPHSIHIVRGGGNAGVPGWGADQQQNVVPP